jgi:regulator of protease activity HflC (stomatin/prohibitin superfamily)
MSIIFIGILLLIGGFILAAAKEPALSKRAGLLKLIGILLIPLGLLTSCIIQIGSGDIGVKVLFGKVQSDVLTSGIHLVNPLMEIIHFDSRTQNYTMSAVHDEGDKMGDDAIRVLSSDGLEVVIDLTVLLRIIPEKAPMILKEMGKDYKNIVVRPVTRTKIRDNAAYYDAVSLYSTKRDEFQKRIFDA